MIKLRLHQEICRFIFTRRRQTQRHAPQRAAGRPSSSSPSSAQLPHLSSRDDDTYARLLSRITEERCHRCLEGWWERNQSGLRTLKKTTQAWTRTQRNQKQHNNNGTCSERAVITCLPTSRRALPGMTASIIKSRTAGQDTRGCYILYFDVVGPGETKESE